MLDYKLKGEFYLDGLSYLVWLDTPFYDLGFLRYTFWQALLAIGHVNIDLPNVGSYVFVW